MIVRAPEVRCVVFDLDDTLFLEREYVHSGFAAVGQWIHDEFGVADFAAHAWARFEQGGRGHIFDEVLLECGCDPGAITVERLVDVYREHQPAIALTEDSAEAIDVLRRSSTTLAVVTDGPLPSQQAKARALGADQWSALTVYTAKLGAGFAKPHPLAFEEVERVTGCSQAECAYVADNPRKDFQAPRHLGWRTVRVRRLQSLHEHVPTHSTADTETPDVRGALVNLGLGGR